MRPQSASSSAPPPTWRPSRRKGKAVDKRADIWAFGVVLYEMLTGRARVRRRDRHRHRSPPSSRANPIGALPAATPVAIRRLLTRCLEKDPKRRLRDIGDARFEIDETIARGSSDAGAAESTGSGLRAPGSGAVLAWTALGIVVGALLAAGLAWSGVWPRARPSESRALSVSNGSARGQRGDLAAECA